MRRLPLALSRAAARWLDRPLALLVTVALLGLGQWWLLQARAVPSEGLSIRTRPPGASVYRLDAEIFLSAQGKVSGGVGEIFIGTSPGPLHLAPSDLPATLVFRLPGYRPQEQRVPRGAFQAGRIYPAMISLQPEGPLAAAAVWLRLFPFAAALGVLALWLLSGLWFRTRERACREDMVARIRRGEVRAGDRIEDYLVERRLGSGGMGTVFQVRRGDQAMALKLLHGADVEPTARSRFEAEVRASVAVAHPQLAYLLDWGEAAGRFYLVSELVEGPVLKQVLESGALPVEECLEWATGIAEALLAIHRAGLVHRDVKPANVARTASGRVKLMDLGIARFTASQQPEHPAGTPGYAAPEQLRGEPVDFRSDLYALGVVLYQMLAGRLPFEARGPWQGVVSFSPLGAEVPQPLRSLVHRLLAPEVPARAERPEQVLEELRHCSAGPGRPTG